MSTINCQVNKHTLRKLCFIFLQLRTRQSGWMGFTFCVPHVDCRVKTINGLVASCTIKDDRDKEGSVPTHENPQGGLK